MALSRRELGATLLAFAAISFYLVLLSASPSAEAQNLLNCSDFASQAAAQQNLRENPSDPNRLDANHNGIACEAFKYPAGSPTDFTPVTLQTTQATSPTTSPTSNATILSPIAPTNQGTPTHRGRRGGATASAGGANASANSGRKPQQEKSIINVPNKPLPPSGGLPVYGVVAVSVLAGVGLLALGLIIRRGARG